MTQEEKAKAYDEAFGLIKRLYHNFKGDAKFIVDKAFPQLNENEDENIRKELIKHLQEGAEGYEPAGGSEDYKRWLSWLEKQGEQKPVETINNKERSKELSLSLQIQAYLNTASDELYAKGKPLYSEKRIEDIHKCMKMWTKLHNTYFYSDLEQKPVELTNGEFLEKCKDLSDLEQYILSLVPIRSIDAIKIDAKNIRHLVEKEQKPTDLRTWKHIVDAVLTDWNGIGNYLDNLQTERLAKKLQERFGTIEQKPVEWSEEDEKFYESFMHKLEVCDLLSNVENVWACNKLKSIRPQKQWKPTMEQMEALQVVLEHGVAAPDREASLAEKHLQEFYEQLKAL